MCFPPASGGLYKFLNARPGRGVRFVSESSVPGISVLGGSAELLEFGLNKRPAPRLLATRLQHPSVSERFDYVIVDTPPAVSTLSRLSFVASDMMVLVTHAEVWALRALGILWSMLAHKNGSSRSEPQSNKLRILINAYDDGQKEQRDAKAVVLERYGDLCLSPSLPHSDDLQNLSLHGDPPRMLDPDIKTAIETLVGVITKKTPVGSPARNTPR
mgnify:CR=1 FL=1